MSEASEHDEPDDVDPNVGDAPEEGDPGWAGGGGPAATIDDTERVDEGAHLADTDHSVT